jgi:hypothetical protein
MLGPAGKAGPNSPSFLDISREGMGNGRDPHCCKLIGFMGKGFFRPIRCLIISAKKRQGSCHASFCLADTRIERT